VGRLRAGVAWVLLAACGRSPLLFDIDEGSAGGGHFDGGDDDGDDDEHRGPRPQLCREVDFLFVIDDSETMGVYQQKVRSNYDVFISGVRDAIDSIDTVHIGVTTTERYWPNPVYCGDLGALVVATDPGGGVQQCGPYRDGHNYMTPHDSLDVSLRCALEVGTAGSDHDTPLGAIVAAISPPLTDAGGCNEGFIGDGALLVLVIVSDSYPSASGASLDVDPYFASVTVVEQMGSYDDVVVVLIASTEDGPCLNPLLPVLDDFAGTFPHSFVGPICTEDYSEIFDGAIEVVKGACPD
jgi:hypothetical protein